MSVTKPQTGFTLIELMVTLLVAALILTVAVPDFRSMMQRNRVAAAANAIVGALAYARSAAVNRGVNVTVCPSTTGTGCTSGAGFQQGWIVFTDAGTPGVVDGSDQVLRVGDPPAVTVVSSGFSNAYITFSSAGFVPAGGGTLKVCPGGNASGVLINLNAAGGVTSNATTCP